MGIPYNKLICASNENNVLTEFLTTGRYDISHRSLHTTSSPAIDILKSSNLERYLYHVTEKDSDTVRELFGDLETKGSFEVPRNVRELIFN